MVVHEYNFRLPQFMYALILVLVFSSSLAKDYFVGGSGASDNNPGTAGKPFATIQKAASSATAGDVITIRSGIYRETIVPTNSGRRGSPIIFQAEAGAKVVISGLEKVEGKWEKYKGNVYRIAITLPVEGHQFKMISNKT